MLYLINVQKKIFLPSGQLSKIAWAISPAESLGLNMNSLVLPLTRINLRLIYNKNTNKYMHYYFWYSYLNFLKILIDNS